MPPAYRYPYQFTPDDGPDAGVLMILPRRYDRFTTTGGYYEWDAIKEGYVFKQGTHPDFGDKRGEGRGR